MHETWAQQTEIEQDGADPRLLGVELQANDAGVPRQFAEPGRLLWVALQLDGNRIETLHWSNVVPCQGEPETEFARARAPKPSEDFAELHSERSSS